MKTILIVTKDFGDYRRGDRIEDQAKVDEYRVSQPNRVVVAQVPDDSVFSGAQ